MLKMIPVLGVAIHHLGKTNPAEAEDGTMVTKAITKVGIMSINLRAKVGTPATKLIQKKWSRSSRSWAHSTRKKNASSKML